MDNKLLIGILAVTLLLVGCIYEKTEPVVDVVVETPLPIDAVGDPWTGEIIAVCNSSINCAKCCELLSLPAMAFVDGQCFCNTNE